MHNPARTLVMSIFACLLFGYAAVNCLVFYRRMRQQAADYKGRPLENFVRSPQYGWTMWLTGAVGVVGFAFSSWELIVSIVAIMHQS
jgi:hypothetical protein